MKHKRNVSFLEARKIVGNYMEENSYASVAWGEDTPNQDNKYRALMEKLIQLELNNWPKFQEHLKKLHSAKFDQVPTQQIKNKEKPNEVVQVKTHIGSTTPTQITPLKSAKSSLTKYKSPIHSQKSSKTD